MTRQQAMEYDDKLSKKLQDYASDCGEDKMAAKNIVDSYIEFLPENDIKNMVFLGNDPVSYKLGNVRIDLKKAILAGVELAASVSRPESIFNYIQMLIVSVLFIRSVTRLELNGIEVYIVYLLHIKPEKIKDCIKSNRWIEKRFTDIVLSIFFCGNVDMCDVSQPENDYLYRQFSNALTDSFLTFIVAHECAHYYLGHLEKDAVKGIVTLGKVQYENLIPDWEQEFDADYIGALLTIPILNERKMDIQVILGGLYVAMWVLSIIENLQIKGGSDKTTHPPAKDRLLQIKEKLQKIMQTDLRVLEIYDVLFSDLWERFSIISEEVETRVLAGRPMAEVSYEQIKKVIYNETNFK